MHQTINYTHIAATMPPTPANSCFIEYPPKCSCRSGYYVFCDDLGWEKVDFSLFDGETMRLMLANVLNGDWKEENLINFTNLKIILIENHPKMKSVPTNFLNGKSTVNRLYLENNTIETLLPSSFIGMSKLGHLYLGGNSIKELYPGAFIGLLSLIELDLSNNLIQLFPMYKFTDLPKLRILYLQRNQIAEIGIETFQNLSSITQLNLSGNKIKYIHPMALGYNKKLRELNISSNNIHHLDSDVFYGLENLILLSLGENPIHRLSPVLFSSIRQLKSLDLEGLELETIDLQIFSLFWKLDFVHFKKFEYCQYVPRVPKCQPSSDGISSIQNLLNGICIRMAVWIIGTITLIGNTLVISSRWKINKETRILDVFIQNLAVADFLMGIYLGIIAIKDIQYRGYFNSYAYYWNTSWECIVTGVIAMISSEVSLLILTLMSLERSMVITRTFSYKKLTKNWAMASMGLLWAFIIVLAVTPALMWKASYFGSSGLCFTLHLHDPFAIGWEYNSFVFIAINSLCLVSIAIFYGRLFWVVRETSSSTPNVEKDLEMAIRLFIMVLTDFLCWASIITLKLLALKGYIVPDSLLAWTTIFVLPLNSAINPMLYTFSTGKIRVKIFDKIFISHTVSTRHQHPNQESIEVRLMTPEVTDDSKINSDWRNKHSASSDQSDSFSLGIGGKCMRSRFQESGISNVSDGATGVISF